MTELEKRESYMRIALDEARKAADEDEVPVGAVVIRAGEVVARAHNQRERLNDPTAHAEVLALREACRKLGTRRLTDCELYVTLEPCPMCAGALMAACLGGCIFGAADEKQGCCESVYALPRDPAFYWRVLCYGGVLEEECAELMRAFMAKRR